MDLAELMHHAHNHTQEKKTTKHLSACNEEYKFASEKFTSLKDSSVTPSVSLIRSSFFTIQVIGLPFTKSRLFSFATSLLGESVHSFVVLSSIFFISSATRGGAVSFGDSILLRNFEE